MYIGTQPYQGFRARHTYTATAGQTSFSGAGAENVTLTYSDEMYIDVYQNGVKLSPADYTATSGTTVVLATGATVSDIVEVVKYDAFSVADTVSAKDGGGFGGNISTSGNLAVTGTSAFTGAITSNAGVVVDNITIDGTEIDLSSGSLTVDSAANITLDCGTGELLFNNGGNGNLLKIQADSSNVNFIGMVQDKDLVFKGNDGGSTITALTLDMSAAGEAKFNDNIVMGTAGKGIHLGVTSATASNLLDDYEEGTWSAGLGSYAGTPTVTGATYTKIGRQVIASAAIELDGTSDTSNFQITGLPFTSANVGVAVYGGFFTYSTTTHTNPIRILVGGANTVANVYTQGGGLATYNGIGNNAAYRFVIIYFTG